MYALQDHPPTSLHRCAKSLYTTQHTNYADQEKTFWALCCDHNKDGHIQTQFLPQHNTNMEPATIICSYAAINQGLQHKDPGSGLQWAVRAVYGLGNASSCLVQHQVFNVLHPQLLRPSFSRLRLQVIFCWSPHQCFVDVVELIFVRPAPVVTFAPLGVIPDGLPRIPVEVLLGTSTTMTTPCVWHEQHNAQYAKLLVRRGNSTV